MNRIETRAARIVAAYHAMRLVPHQDPALREAFRGLVRELVPAMALGEEGLHIRLEKQPGALGRPLHFYAVAVRGRTYATLVMNDVHEKTGKPRPVEDLRKMALAGESRFLDDREIWLNPYWDGRIRGEICWYGGKIWDHCGNPEAKAARLAWEAITENRPWKWDYGRDQTKLEWFLPDGTPNPESRLTREQKATLKAVRNLAESFLPEMLVGVQNIPIELFARRGDSSVLSALAHYLVADRNGPRMPWALACKLLGYDNLKIGYRTLYSEVHDYHRDHPAADKPPKGKARTRYSIVADGSTQMVIGHDATSAKRSPS